MTGTRATAFGAALLVFGLLAFSANRVFAAKEVFVRCKPHVNVGTVGGDPAQIWLHANAGVAAGGEAVGILQLRVLDGESFLYRVTSGRAVVDRDTVVELILVLERVGEAGGGDDLAIVRPSANLPDRLIFDILGANVQVEAEGQLSLRRR